MNGDEEQRQKAKFVHDFLAGDEPVGLGLKPADLTPGVGAQNPTEWDDGQLEKVANSSRRSQSTAPRCASATGPR